MRSLMLLLALFISNILWACPELQGRYDSCKSLAGNMPERKDLIIDQKTDSTATVYTLEEIEPESNQVVESEIRADGKVLSEIDPFNDVVVRTITYCKKNELLMDSKYFYLGKKIGSMLTVTKKVGERVIIEANGTVQNKSYKDAIICE